MTTQDPFIKQNSLDTKPDITDIDTKDKFDNKMKKIFTKEKEREAKDNADNFGMSYYDLKGFPINSEALSIIPEKDAAELKAICFFLGASDARVATTNPDNPKLKELIAKISKDYHVNTVLYFVSQASFDFAFKLYETLPKIRKMVGGVEITEEEIKKYSKEISTFKDLDKKLAEVTITDMLTLIIAAAIKARSSDIHVEAEEKGIKIRFRIDGLLNDVAELSPKIWPQVISRIKLIARLKINVADRPQDGRFTIYLNNEKIDVRVSALPTAYGESVVMRLLMSSTVGVTFDNLGLRGRAYEVLKNEILKPNGMIVTTGPTGSGKTTSLYAILNKLNNPETKIITVEDPVEYKLQGINQSQIDSSRGYTFANGLRSILRQDPDVIMVGEIRDLETAEIAINAALTGHLVLSTIHTNDAAGTIPRFLSMQVKPYLLAPSLNAMIGQRLLRRVCEKCKVPAEIDEKTMARVHQILSEIPEKSGEKKSEEDIKKVKFFKGAGCDECQGLGYKGRIGIYEIMAMTKEIEKLILSGQVSEYDMRTLSMKNGMVTMIQDGLLKACDGITTVDEVFRVAKDVSAAE